jgi:hypothetical protein
VNDTDASDDVDVAAGAHRQRGDTMVCVVAGPERPPAAPDCGVKYVPRDAAKLEVLVEVAWLAPT